MLFHPLDCSDFISLLSLTSTALTPGPGGNGQLQDAGDGPCKTPLRSETKEVTWVLSLLDVWFQHVLALICLSSTFPSQPSSLHTADSNTRGKWRLDSPKKPGSKIRHLCVVSLWISASLTEPRARTPKGCGNKNQKFLEL